MKKTNIVDMFSDWCDYYVEEKDLNTYFVLDLQFVDSIEDISFAETVNKKDWLEKIKSYYGFEILDNMYNEPTNKDISFSLICVAKCNQDIQKISKNRHIKYKGEIL